MKYRGIYFVIFLFFFYAKVNASKTDSILVASYDLTVEANNFRKQSMFFKAEEKLFQAIELWDTNNVLDEWKFYPYYSLGLVYREMGFYEKSINSYNQAEQILINTSSKDSSFYCGLYNSMGNYYLYTGDYIKALDYYEYALSMNNQDIRNMNIYYYSMIGIAQVYYYTDRQNEAISKTLIAMSLAKRYNLDKKPSFSTLANNYIKQGRFNDALEILINLKTSLSKPIDIFENDVVLLRVYIELGKFEKASDIISKNLNNVNQLYSEHDSWSVYFKFMQGHFYSERSKIESNVNLKEQYLLKAIDLYNQALTNNSMHAEGKIPYLDLPKGDFVTPTQVNEIFINRANALSELFNLKRNTEPEALSLLEEALKTYQAAINFTYELKVSLKDEESKLLLSEDQSDTYIEAFKIAYDLYTYTGNEKYKDKLFEIAEQSKSSTFLSSLNSAQALNFGGIPDSILQKEKHIKQKLTNYKQLIFNADVKSSTDSILLAQWESNLFKSEKEYDDLMYLLERKYEDYYNFKYKKSTIRPKDIRKTLSSNQILLEYLIDEPINENDSGTVYVLKITENNFEVKEQAISYDYIENLNTLHQILSSRNVANTNKQDYIEYVQSAYGLYEDLIGPFINQKRQIECIVVPDDKMAYIPLDALISEFPDTTELNFRDLSYLIYDYNFSYSYSSTLHFDYFKSKSSVKNEILAFAPTYNNNVFDLNKEAYDVRQSELFHTLRPLPGAQLEVESLREKYKCEAYTGNVATETTFKESSEKYDILHLAMHTVINDSLPMFSKLVFSAEGDTLNDGYLNTQEIYNMKFKARLAVLSACNTGSGKFRNGEGVMSLARAFLYAGCPSIVMTLWEVEDKSSSSLIDEFYDALYHGFSKSEALRQAKQNHIKNSDQLRAHPYFWSGYIVIGNQSPIKLNNGAIYFIILLLAITGFLVFMGFRIVKLKKSKSPKRIN